MSAPMIAVTRYVAACDACGALSFINPDLIPERDTDMDDAEHDNRPPIGVCGIIRLDHHRDEDDGCIGSVYYVGETTLGVSV